MYVPFVCATCFPPPPAFQCPHPRLPMPIQRIEQCEIMCCRYFDFGKLAEITQQVTKNLNKIIDINYYPVETARRSNVRNRPIGIGVQVLGLPCS